VVRLSHKSFELDNITKIEGNTKLSVEIDNNQVKDVRLEVFESSRFFEALTKGRRYHECAVITQRICGICSFIHTITSLKAMENLLDVKISEESRKLRELLIIAGNIHSHVVHLYFMSLPEYLGYESAIEMSEKDHEQIHRALRLKNLGSSIGKIIGGRMIHPVTPCIGGFWNFPDKEKLEIALEKFKKSRKDAKKLVETTYKIKYPDLETKSNFFALRKDGEYQLYDGIITSLDGIDFEPENYDQYLEEEVNYNSTAKRCKIKDQNFMVGALARLNINHQFLSDQAKIFLKRSGVKLPCRNPYYNNFAQALEVLHFIDKGIKLTEELLDSNLKNNRVETKPKKGRGIATCEAPRGLLFHDYTINGNGIIQKTNVITPTVPNLVSMEQDLKELLTQIIDQPKEEMISHSEKLIRAYDPCISCATHFLELEIKKNP